MNLLSLGLEKVPRTDEELRFRTARNWWQNVGNISHSKYETEDIYFPSVLVTDRQTDT
jgi:hypothetical protein